MGKNRQSIVDKKEYWWFFWGEENGELKLLLK
jgi:hypothetical protein